MRRLIGKAAMQATDEQWVPKVHPTSRPVEAEDPMLLVGSEATGDPQVMLDCMIQEFSWMGFDVGQLMELLTRYGEISEVWFDGANGEGPNGKRQVYDWEAYYATIRKLQPKALIAISGPDIRWVGNEDGFDAPPVAELHYELARAVDGDLMAHDARLADLAFRLEHGAEPTRQVRHAREVGDASLMDPAVELPRVKPLAAVRFDKRLEIAQLHFGEVGARAHRYVPCLL